MDFETPKIGKSWLWDPKTEVFGYLLYKKSTSQISKKYFLQTWFFSNVHAKFQVSTSITLFSRSRNVAKKVNIYIYIYTHVGRKKNEVSLTEKKMKLFWWFSGFWIGIEYDHFVGVVNDNTNFFCGLSIVGINIDSKKYFLVGHRYWGIYIYIQWRSWYKFEKNAKKTVFFE